MNKVCSESFLLCPVLHFANEYPSDIGPCMNCWAIVPAGSWMLRHHPPGNFCLHVKNMHVQATHPWLLDMMTNNAKSLTKDKFVTTQPLQLINTLLMFLLEGQGKVKCTFCPEEPKQFFILFLRWWWQQVSWKPLYYLLSVLQSFLLHWHLLQHVLSEKSICQYLVMIVK